MNKSSLTSKLLFISWLFTICLVIFLIAFILGASVFRHISTGGDRLPKYIQQIVEKVVELPRMVIEATNEIRDQITDKPSILLIPKNSVVRPNWVHQFPAPQDNGYLLLSGLSAKENQSIIQLIRISDGQVLAKWIPDWKAIHHQTSSHRHAPKGNVRAYRAFHPLLLDDGSIIFNTGASLVRVPLCSSKPSWILDFPHHHSIELSQTGDSVWVPSVTEHFASENPILKKKLRDDSLAEVSLDGRIIQNLSFSKILAENGMTAHMLGSTSQMTISDPLHINQITPALSDSSYWRRGDLLISARHTSTVYLFRPSTGKIIWYQQGPWLNQHSAHFLNDSTIAVFGNDVYGDALKNPFIYKEGHNQIYLHDFRTTNTKKLHTNTLNEIKPTTDTEGRSLVLEDGSIFIEETNNARLFKLSPSGDLVWSYINEYNTDYLGLISWSRYLTPNELRAPIKIINTKCDN